MILWHKKGVELECFNFSFALATFKNDDSLIIYYFNNYLNVMIFISIQIHVSHES